MKKILSFIFIILTAFSLVAQKQWTLKECIDYALEHNIQIKQNYLNLQLSKGNLLQSKMALLPNINGSASQVYNYGKTIDMFTNTFATEKVQSNNFYISSGITLFNGFQLLNSIKQNQYETMAAAYDLNKFENDISLSIATAYLQILYNQELLEIAKNQLLITKQQVERTKKLVDAGTLAKGSLFTIQAQEASEELQVVNAENQLDLSLLTLIQLIDLESPKDFAIEKPNIEIAPDISFLSEPFTIYEKSLTILPEIKSAELKVKSAYTGLSLARGRYSPNLSLRGSIGTGYSGASNRFTGFSVMGEDIIGYTSEPIPVPVVAPHIVSTYEKIPFNDQINDNVNKSIGVYLTIPIFNNFQVKNSINASKINLKNAEYNLDLTKNNLNKSIYQAYADAKAALKRYYATLKAVEAMEESFKYTQQKFDVGLVTSLDYNDAKNKLVKAKSDLLQAKYEYIFRIKILDFYQGKPISF
jgi:outer membrane protein